VRVFDFNSALVREPGASVVRGLRTGPHPPDFDVIAAEHRIYVAALEAAGLRVDTLPALEEFPDSVFVEDAALVLPEGAIVLRPGAPSRGGEGAAIADALNNRFRRVLTLDRGCADGGDLLVLPDEILIGLSARTDRLGATRMAEFLAELGRSARIVSTPPGTLHFKTACALVDEQTILATPQLAQAGLFDGLEVLVTPQGEEGAANLVRMNDCLLIGADYPRTAKLLAARGPTLVPLSVAEMRKLDAGLSCLSLRWHDRERADLGPLITGSGRRGRA
jgi:dimethylargininase